MYLHIGQDTVVPFEDIIGIFDLDRATSSRTSREFLERAQRDGQITTVGTDIPKSFLVCGDGRQRVYLTQLGTAALRARSESFSIE